MNEVICILNAVTLPLRCNNHGCLVSTIIDINICIVLQQYLHHLLGIVHRSVVNRCEVIRIFKVNVWFEITQILLQECFDESTIIATHTVDEFNVVLLFAAPPSLPDIFMSTLEFIEVFLVVRLAELIELVDCTNVIYLAQKKGGEEEKKGKERKR